jgi:RNase adaptor protein for sRNA GlmZ degradation
LNLPGVGMDTDMLSLIIKSNHRARVALLVIQLDGRQPQHMAELRDGLNQRQAMRESAHFAIWVSRHEASLRERFNLFRARHPFMIAASQDAEKQFAEYCLREYRSELTP